jgi:NAD(P)-dependent dehydrogenase (short-subunit alcohol dehydrogenase family)
MTTDGFCVAIERRDWMYPELAGKLAVVTGAGNNLGRDIALSFAASGAYVASVDINLDSANETCAMAKARGNEMKPYRVDIGDSADVEALVQRLIKDFRQIDIWINNAGLSQTGRPFITDSSEELFDRIVRVNLKGVWIGMKAVLPHMVERGSGCIVNMSSVLGLVAAPGMAIYAATKHGVIGMTKAAALEYGPKGVRVNAVCPSRMEGAMSANALDPKLQQERLAGTRAMNPANGRAGRSEEVAATIQFLCSNGASHIHGAAIPVDAAFTVQ